MNDAVRDPRFDILFQPLKIGPVTAPNRFYQVPHCTGMGYGLPKTLATMRGVKAEGGWGVVCTEYCSIDPAADDHPSPYASLWDAGDVANLALMAEKVHAHGALAGVELWHGGLRSSNLFTRTPAIGPESLPADKAPSQSQRMDLTDIRDYRRAHRAAALRAREAGCDIVYVYAAHSYLVSQFLDPRINRRILGYSGSFEARARLVLELLDDVKSAVGDRCAVAIRIEVDPDGTPGADPDGERRALFELMRDAPDLFDVTVSDYGHEMGVSRFHREGSLEPLIAHVKQITGKPVVSVGRFTSPETMLGMVTRGIVDLIGAARPSIADPFLPRKIEEGRLDDIRECIGCNICYASDVLGVPLRCTQNPTMGEEWRRGWHPERTPISDDPQKILIIGGGPAGLEAALTLGRMGHSVMLAEATRALGGRVSLESRLPGLQEWARVRDYRVHQLSKLPNVEIFLESRMTAEDVQATDARHVLIATGSRWRANGMGGSYPAGDACFDDPRVLTPDDVMAGRWPTGAVTVFDDDGYLMGAVIAELLAKNGASVTYVTPSGLVSPWTVRTREQADGQRRLIELGVAIQTGRRVSGLPPGLVELACVYTGAKISAACDALISVTSREPEDEIWHALMETPEANEAAGILSVQRIGDCRAPGLIAAAVYDGHRCARELQTPQHDRAPLRERVVKE